MSRKSGSTDCIPTTRAESRPESSLASAAPFLLEHSWPDGSRPTKTVVRVAWTPEELLVRGEMEDEDVTTLATADSQHLWDLGDVFEIFLEAEGAGFYTEMHVAPGNHRLHLRFGIGDSDGRRQKKCPPSDLMIRPPGFESRSAVTPFGWTAEVRIPAVLVDPLGRISSDSRWLASFCRYDAWSDGRRPVLSSTSPHEQLNFHRRQEWRPLCF